MHRGNVLKGQGLLHEAVHAYTGAIALGGGTDALAYNNLGGSLQARGSTYYGYYYGYSYGYYGYYSYLAYGRQITCTPAPPASAASAPLPLHQALGSSQLALEAYTSAIALDPADRTARDNLNKLPVGPPYRGMAAYETKVLAARAAAATLAVHGARRAASSGGGGSGGGGGGGGVAAGVPQSVLLYRTLRYLRRLETEQTPPPPGASLWPSP